MSYLTGPNPNSAYWNLYWEDDCIGNMDWKTSTVSGYGLEKWLCIELWIGVKVSFPIQSNTIDRTPVDSSLRLLFTVNQPVLPVCSSFGD